MASIDRLLTTATDHEHVEFDWGEITWLDSAALTDSNALTVGTVTIRGGAENPEHVHPNCDEALYLLSGELEHTLGAESITLSAGELLHIPTGEPHRAINHGEEDAVAVIVYDTGEREFEVVS